MNKCKAILVKGTFTHFHRYLRGDMQSNNCPKLYINTTTTQTKMFYTTGQKLYMFILFGKKNVFQCSCFELYKES